MTILCSTSLSVNFCLLYDIIFYCVAVPGRGGGERVAKPCTLHQQFSLS